MSTFVFTGKLRPLKLTRDISGLYCLIHVQNQNDSLATSIRDVRSLTLPLVTLTKESEKFLERETRGPSCYYKTTFQSGNFFVQVIKTRNVIFIVKFQLER